jgi:hypothetical protein
MKRKELTMASAQTITELPRELAYRMNDGLEVSLLWLKRDNRLTVLVADERTGDSFELPVGTQQPLDVFYHPFAYAAFHGVECGLAELGTADPVYA